MKRNIKQQIRNEILQIQPFDDLENEHIADSTAWIDGTDSIFRVKKPDIPPKHLVSYFVLVDPVQSSVLLGDHIKSQLWLPSGGHVMPDEDPRDTVVRECKEEVGQVAKFLRNNDHPLFITVTDTVGLTAGHTDVSLWYLLKASVHDRINFERREFTDMNWFTFDEILSSHPAIFDPHMHRFTQKLVDFLG